ncbi:MAG: prepilin peptidase [Parvularculaceae bacterium]|nr:prepilin peptidase [Parvularculaceae bacterium]
MLPLIFLSAFPAALIIAALNDIYEFKIPNWISIVLIAAYGAAGVGLAAPGDMLLEGLLLGCAALVAGFALFALRIIGGGDAKLLAASAPWIGLSSLGSFMIYVAIAGGALALALIVFRRLPALPAYAQAPWLVRLHQRPKDIPYGVAIAAGGLLSFSQTPLFQLAFGG